MASGIYNIHWCLRLRWERVDEEVCLPSRSRWSRSSRSSGLARLEGGTSLCSAAARRLVLTDLGCSVTLAMSTIAVQRKARRRTRGVLLFRMGVGLFRVGVRLFGVDGGVKILRSCPRFRGSRRLPRAFLPFAGWDWFFPGKILQSFADGSKSR